MKAWRIHIVWVAVCVLFGVVLSQYLLKKEREEARQRERELRGQISDLKRERDSLTEADGDDPFDAGEGETEFGEGDAGENGEAPPEEEGEARRRERGESLTPEKILAMLRSRSRRDQWRAFRAIREMKDPRQKLSMIQAILDGSNGRMKVSALQWLAEIGGPEAANLAAGILEGKENDWLRNHAARALADLGGAKAMTSLLGVFQTEESLWLRTGTAAALNRLGQPGPTQEMVQILSRILDDPDGAKREDAAENLGRLRSPAALPYLGQALSDPNSRVRRTAVDGLGDSGLQEAIPLLQPMLKDPNPEVAERAKRAIRKIQNPERDDH